MAVSLGVVGRTDGARVLARDILSTVTCTYDLTLCSPFRRELPDVTWAITEPTLDLLAVEIRQRQQGGPVIEMLNELQVTAA